MPVAYFRHCVLLAVLCPVWVLAAEKGATTYHGEVTYHFDPVNDLSDEQSARMMVADEAGNPFNPFNSKIRTKGIDEIARSEDGNQTFIRFKKLRSTPGGKGALVVAPGNYTVKLSCDGALGLLPIPLQRISPPVQVEAGFDYWFVCTGRGGRDTRAEVQSYPRNLAVVEAAALARKPLIEKRDQLWLPQAQKEYTDIPMHQFAIPETVSDARLEEAIEFGFKQRGWQANDHGQGWYRATLPIRTHTVTVDVAKVGNDLRFVYIDSTNMNFEVNKGAAALHRNYHVWVDELALDITRRLGLPPPPKVASL